MVYWFIDLNHGYLVSIGRKYLFRLKLRLFNFISTFVISGTNSTIFLLCLTTTVNGATPLDKLLIEIVFGWQSTYLFLTYGMQLSQDPLRNLLSQFVPSNQSSQKHWYQAGSVFLLRQYPLLLHGSSSHLLVVTVD